MEGVDAHRNTPPFSIAMSTAFFRSDPASGGTIDLNPTRAGSCEGRVKLP